MSKPRALLNAVRTYLAAAKDPVVSGFLDGFGWDLPQRNLLPVSIPVIRHLETMNTSSALLGMLSASAADLHWGRTYTAADFGGHFLENYGWVELFGSRGHFASEAMAGGFLLLGPQVVYPDHHHIAEEIYIPLTDGALWSRDRGPSVARTAGEVIHHPSGIHHAMTTTQQPLAALYLWRGGPLSEKPKFEGNAR